VLPGGRELVAATEGTAIPRGAHEGRTASGETRVATAAREVVGCRCDRRVPASPAQRPSCAERVVDGVIA
jgi:hypothetical protein